jgi:hypothetical protein
MEQSSGNKNITMISKCLYFEKILKLKNSIH